MKNVKSITIILLVSLSICGCKKPGDAGGFFTKVSGKVTHFQTGQPIANSPIYIYDGLSALPFYVDTIYTNNQGLYEVAYFTRSASRISMLYSGSHNESTSCLEQFSGKEGADNIADKALYPTQPLLQINAEPYAQSVGATRVWVTLENLACHLSYNTTHFNSFQATLDVLPNNTYLVSLSFYDQNIRVSNKTDTLSIGESPLVYTP